MITATQMLDSMIENPRPTRAEITDVANAIYDGTSAIMLSGETAAGKYPVEAVQTMDAIARKTESNIDRICPAKTPKRTRLSITAAAAHAACTTAEDIGADAILTVSQRGITAQMVSRFRPAATSNYDFLYFLLYHIFPNLSIFPHIFYIISGDLANNSDVLQILALTQLPAFSCTYINYSHHNRRSKIHCACNALIILFCLFLRLCQKVF